MAKKKYPLAQDTFIELASQIADLVVQQWGRDTGNQVSIEEGNEVTYTEAAQDIFNARYDQAQGILAEVLGTPPWLE